MRNLITDVPGIRIGNAHGAAVASGVTVALFDRPAITGVVVPGGAPGGRETALLEPEMTVEAVDAVVLSGGSTLGLDAATGVQIWLRERGRGFPIGTVRVPIVTQAICFDLLNGGAKDWGAAPPYRDWATEACEAAGDTFALGSVGGGYGATTLDLKGGLGSASALAPSGHVVGALAVVNAIGSAAVGGGPHFWAGPWEVDAEFGGLGPLLAADASALMRLGGLSEMAAAALKVAEAAALAMLRTKITHKPVLASWDALLDYLRADMAHRMIERVRVLHLDTKNALIRDELVAEGSIDQAAVHVREVIRRAIDLGAASLILVHNHPSGDPAPSRQDIALTREIVDAARPLGISVHDHIIVGANGHSSMRAQGLM